MEISVRKSQTSKSQALKVENIEKKPFTRLLQLNLQGTSNEKWILSKLFKSQSKNYKTKNEEQWMSYKFLHFYLYDVVYAT